MSKAKVTRKKSTDNINAVTNIAKTQPKRKKVNSAIVELTSSSDEEIVSKSPKAQKLKKSSKTTKTPPSRKKVKSESASVEDEAEKPIAKPKRKRKLAASNDSNPADESAETTEKKRKKANSKPSDQETSTEALQSLIETHIGSENVIDMDWTESQYISELHNVSECVASNVVQLFEQENTVPFIARYRRNMTGGLEAEMLRALKESYDRSKLIKQRASTILKTIDKQGKWTPSLHALVKSAKSLNTLEYINSLFKVPGKRSLSEKAKQLGLGEISDDVLNGRPLRHLSSFVNPSKEGLENEKQVREGIIHILADIISKDKNLFDKIQELKKKTVAYIEVSQRKGGGNKEKVQQVKDEKKGNVKKTEKVAEDKYENYYNFRSRSDTIKPHQILAINRGENQKFLTVKVSIPGGFEHALKREFQNIYRRSLDASQFHGKLLMESFDYAYKKSIEPALVRRIRNELNEQAESASIEVFATNLKQLLLAPPFRGKTILGIDPGFFHGCKLAVISETGSVLATNVMYLSQMKAKVAKQEDPGEILSRMIKDNNCTVIALGNGTACRETEMLIADLIKAGTFKPLDVSYTIVNECGASIYSCGEEAKKEFPNMDYNLISAISIARRLQDPLAELVKIEPKHLGVGMYQHDLPQKQLDATLNEVVIEAVSFVGVDINTSSLCLLKRIAGLTLSRAKAILDWRSQNGCFTSRKQLMDVKGIGAKTFEQCAGFIRVNPETAATSAKSRPFNYLDQTWIHPESYEIANKLIKDAGCDVRNLGSDDFITKITDFAQMGNAKLASRYKTEESTIEIIVKGLTMKKDSDIRMKSEKPLFRKSLKGLEDLEVGMTLRGQVRNVTHFGAFVDVGVKRDGLIPLKFMKGQSLTVGQKVEVRVQSMERERGRLCLELIC